MGIRRSLLIVFALALVTAGCEDKKKTAATVGSATISAEQVDQILEHAREEAKREGKRFPAEGSPRFRLLERQAVDLLIYHAELAQKGAGLGIKVTDSDVEARMSGGGAEEGDAEAGAADKAFREESIRSQLLYRRIYQRVTRNASVTESEIRAYYRAHRGLYRQQGLTLAAARATIERSVLDTKRNATMARWVAGLKREFALQVRYEGKFR